MYNSDMSTISFQEIERDPAAFLQRLEAGEPFLVAHDGRLVAEIKPMPTTVGLRPYGLCAGQFTVPADFDEPLPEDILKEFEGR
jgi:antitoxin (DNA-binding transcriptional repressor) of toxin-antitoxin stability system